MNMQKPVCRHCGSDDIVIDAAARWDVSLQQWQLASVHDCTWCVQCERDNDRGPLFIDATETHAPMQTEQLETQHPEP